jgi:isocitrate dehydrogenase
MPEPRITIPADGAKIGIANGKLSVPPNPIIPFIEGDGTGPDIWRASVRVLDAAVAKTYGGKRQITTSSTTGCPTPRSTSAASTWSPSRAR